MSILRAIEISAKNKIERKWEKEFYFFDIHSTILYPNYKSKDVEPKFYPYAKEALKILTKAPDVTLVIYTCSKPEQITKYMEFFKANDIEFTYINENPEVKTGEDGYGCYDTKPYISVLFEDKAGFSGEEDWLPILGYLKNKYKI
jgi:hypothetical protein